MGMIYGGGGGLINDFGGSLSDNRMIVHGSESLRRDEGESPMRGGIQIFSGTRMRAAVILIFPPEMVAICSFLYLQTRTRQEVRQLTSSQSDFVPINAHSMIALNVIDMTGPHRN